MAPGRALQVLAVALALGEGCTWLALALVAASTWAHGGARVPRSLGYGLRAWRQGVRALGALGGAPWGLVLYAAAGAAAWWAGPFGLLRPSALGHCLPVLAWPLVARAARLAHPAHMRQALQLFVAAVLGAVVVGALASVPWRERMQALVRLDRFVAEQGLRPGGALQAVGGLYFHRLKMAHVLLLALAWPVALLLAPGGPLPLGPTSKEIQARWAGRQAAVCGALLALGAALLFTFARAAYGAAAGALVCVGLAALCAPGANRRRLIAWALACCMATAAAVAWAPEVRARLLSSRSSEAAGVRAVIWTEAVVMVWEHPLGIGLGNYPEVVASYYAALDPLTKSPRTYPHNLLWMAWAEGGFLGVLGMALFWARLVTFACAQFVQPLRPEALGQGHSEGPGQRHAAAALLFAVTALALVGCTHDVLFHNIVALAFFCGLGAATWALPARRPHLC